MDMRRRKSEADNLNLTLEHLERSPFAEKNLRREDDWWGWTNFCAFPSSLIGCNPKSEWDGSCWLLIG